MKLLVIATILSIACTFGLGNFEKVKNPTSQIVPVEHIEFDPLFITVRSSH